MVLGDDSLSARGGWGGEDVRQDHRFDLFGQLESVDRIQGHDVGDVLGDHKGLPLRCRAARRST